MKSFNIHVTFDAGFLDIVQRLLMFYIWLATNYVWFTIVFTGQSSRESAPVQWRWLKLAITVCSVLLWTLKNRWQTSALLNLWISSCTHVVAVQSKKPSLCRGLSQWMGKEGLWMRRRRLWCVSHKSVTQVLAPNDSAKLYSPTISSTTADAAAEWTLSSTIWTVTGDYHSFFEPIHVL